MERCDCCGGNKRPTSTPTSKVAQLWRTASCPSPFASAPPPRQQVLAPARTYSQPINFDTTNKVEAGVRKFITGNSAPVPTSSPEKRSPVEMIKKEEEDKDSSTKKQGGGGEEKDQDDGQGVLYTVSFRCNCGAAHKFTFRKG